MAMRWLKCKACGKEFVSGMDLPSTMTIGANTHECPHCRRSGRYSGADYYERKPN